jgi:hypothetical protein
MRRRIRSGDAGIGLGVGFVGFTGWMVDHIFTGKRCPKSDVVVCASLLLQVGTVHGLIPTLNLAL